MSMSYDEKVVAFHEMCIAKQNKAFDDEQADAKQFKQDEETQEEYRCIYVEVMARTKVLSEFKFFEDKEAKILEDKILEQAEIDAKQAKQDEAAKEEFRRCWADFMARTKPPSKFFEEAKAWKEDEEAKEEYRLLHADTMARIKEFEDSKAEKEAKMLKGMQAGQEANDAARTQWFIARKMAKAKKLADEQAEIDAKQAKIDALSPIGKFARKFWIVVGIEIARLSELYNNA
ncbi:hypothetical protein T484DRAFT_3649250 [Baffinella frigidus]|nr:hypothetical protein T484DRAFT_3649250 [Cryptophyta sp. CCMP2293]